jgi:hypothetical protein
VPVHVDAQGRSIQLAQFRKTLFGNLAFRKVAFDIFNAHMFLLFLTLIFSPDPPANAGCQNQEF